MHGPSRHEPKLMVGLVWGVIMGLALYAALARAALAVWFWVR